MTSDKYEYRVYSPNAFVTPEAMEESMNALGEEGFRFISAFKFGTSDFLLFSKPKFMKMPYRVQGDSTGKFTIKGGSSRV